MPSYVDTLANRYGEDFASELLTDLEGYALEAVSFLEWGAGESTRVIADFASARSCNLFLSIDHDTEYLKNVAASIPPLSFIEFRCFDLQGPSFSQDDHGCNYSSYPKDMGYLFDFILIDGRRRVECALIASQIVRPGGVVLLHDWRRSRYASIREIFDVEHEGKQFLVLRSRYKPVTKPVVEETEKRAIFVILQGAAIRAQFEISSPSLHEYARRCSAKLHVIEPEAHVPNAALKSLVVPHARSYQRFAILDADIIVRSHAPDLFEIVPPDRLGVMIEGRMLDRRGECERISHLYDLQPTISPDRYFNSGVLVMSQEHLPMLEALCAGLVFASPLYEQGFLNAYVHRKNIALYDLPASLNYLLASGFGVDWRWGSLIHFAGGGKTTLKHDRVWVEETFGQGRYLSSVPLMGHNVRVQRMLEIASQITGKRTRVFDADDMHFNFPNAYPELVNGTVLINLGVSPSLPRAVWGPYAQIEAGRWQIRVLDPSLDRMIDQHIMVDAARKVGTEILLNATRLDEQDVCIDVPEGTTDLEIRLNISEGHARILAIVIELVE